MNKKALLMNEIDNVATIIDEIYRNDYVDIMFKGECVKSIQVIENIDCYHKIAYKEIQEGQKVYKYGEIIGQASQNIGTGEYVHIHNIESVMTR